MKAWIIVRKQGERHFGWSLTKGPSGQTAETWTRTPSSVNKFLFQNNAIQIAGRKEGAFIMELEEFESLVAMEDKTI